MSEIHGEVMQEIQRGDVVRDKEAEYAHAAIQELDNLLYNEAFRDRVVTLGASAEIAALNKAMQKPVDTAKGKIKSLVEVEAMKALGDTELEAAKKKGKEYGAALQAVREVPFEGQTYAVTKMSSPELQEIFENDLKADESYQGELASAQEFVEKGKLREMEKFSILQKELGEKKDSFALADAMKVWGRSPDSEGSWGEENKGFHAGVTHYFEYRQNSEKAGRYKREKIPFGIEGFEIMSQNLRQVIDTPTKENELVEDAVRIGDELGQERLIALTKSGELVVAFQRNGEPMRVISVIPSDKKSFEKAVKNELEPKPGAKPRLNSLGEKRAKLS